VKITRSTMDAYAIFYPTADENDVRLVVEQGLVIENAIALKLVGRRSPHHRMSQGSYVLHPERTGLFVLSDLPDQAVVTFLLFYSWLQFRLACRLYSENIAMLTGSVPWVDQYWRRE